MVKEYFIKRFFYKVVNKEFFRIIQSQVIIISLCYLKYKYFKFIFLFKNKDIEV